MKSETGEFIGVENKFFHEVSKVGKNIVKVVMLSPIYLISFLMLQSAVVTPLMFFFGMGYYLADHPSSKIYSVIDDTRVDLNDRLSYRLHEGNHISFIYISIVRLCVVYGAMFMFKYALLTGYYTGSVLPHFLSYPIASYGGFVYGGVAILFIVYKLFRLIRK